MELASKGTSATTSTRTLKTNRTYLSLPTERPFWATVQQGEVERLVISWVLNGKPKENVPGNAYNKLTEGEKGIFWQNGDNTYAFKLPELGDATVDPDTEEGMKKLREWQLFMCETLRVGMTLMPETAFEIPHDH